MNTMTLTVDGLAQEIRRLDGNPTMGAGILAESLMPFITAHLDAEAKAVPRAWLHQVSCGDGELDEALSFKRDSFPLDGVAGYHSQTVIPLYTRSQITAQLTHCQCQACTVTHASDCAVHNGPALPIGPCDCGAIPQAAEQDAVSVSDEAVASFVEKAASIISNAPFANARAYAKARQISDLALESFARGKAAQPSVPVDDKKRLDFLEFMCVAVRTPLRYGSRAEFIAAPIDGDGEQEPSDIRAQIDKLIAEHDSKEGA